MRTFLVFLSKWTVGKPEALCHHMNSSLDMVQATKQADNALEQLS